MSWDIIKMQICKFLFPSNLPRYVHEKNLGVVATMMVDFKFKTVIAIINKVCTADLQIIGPWTNLSKLAVQLRVTTNVNRNSNSYCMCVA